MPRRSISPRRSPSRRSRSPSGARSRGGSHRDDRYDRDSKSRDDGGYSRRNRDRSREGRDRDTRDRRDDYRRDRPRDGDRRDYRRDDRERDRYDDDRRSSRREGSHGEPRGERRNEREPDSRRPRSKSRSQSRSPLPEEDKAKPNFANSGLLAAATNTVKHGDGTSTLLKYNEPPEARKPVENWRLYVFKGKEQVDLLHLHRQSAYLIGRDPKICDLPIEHPSCSKQHAVIQFRQVHVKDEFGTVKAVIKPFVIDLESTNGTMVNDTAIPVSRYYELKASDVLKFGESTREYVLLHDNAL